MTVSRVTGITGQDGPYLARLLRAEGAAVWGASRRGRLPPELGFVRPARVADVGEGAAVAARPNGVSHLAARSSVGASWEDPAATGEAAGVGTAGLREAVWRVAPAARVFVASLSEVFDEPERAPWDEADSVAPDGAAKADAHHLARYYRRRYGLRVMVGIRYNHVSPRRPPEFVSRTNTRGAAAITPGETSEPRLGNHAARRDWDFTFVIAISESRPVLDWCELAFARAGIEWRHHVAIYPVLWRPAESGPLVGDASKVRDRLGWEPSLPLAELEAMMVDADEADGA